MVMNKNPKKPVVIVVDSDGDIITYTDGEITCDNPELVEKVEKAPFLPWRVQLISPFGQYVRPSLDPANLIGVTAAMYSANPGRSRLLEGPKEVRQWFKKEYKRYGGGCIPQATGKRDYTPRPLSEILAELSRYYGQPKQ